MHLLVGGGVAILYLSFYVAFALYHLISQPFGFALWQEFVWRSCTPRVFCIRYIQSAYQSDYFMKRHRLEGFAFLALFAGISVLLFFIFSPFLQILVLAAVFAVVLQKPYESLSDSFAVIEVWQR